MNVLIGRVDSRHVRRYIVWDELVDDCEWRKGVGVMEVFDMNVTVILVLWFSGKLSRVGLHFSYCIRQFKYVFRHR
jgi:hypothetical protein